jgi:hypothetical protein
VNLAATIDGVTATGALSGYNSPAGTTASTTLRVTYTLNTQHPRVRGLRLWNQAGNDLNDADGIGPFTVEYYSGATLLSTQSYVGVNGGQAQSFYLPNGAELSGVDSVVLRSLGKISGSTVAPLWRELQLLEYQTVIPCRRTNGTLEWYNLAGTLVPSADIVPCDPIPVNPVPDLVMTGSAFGDDPTGTAENICAITPAPVSTTGWAAPVGGCYDPTAGAPTMTWGPLASVEMEYSNGPGNQASGGVLMSFSTPTGGGAITWPTNLTNMQVGEQRLSNVFGNGRRARITLVSAPGSGPTTNGSIRMEGGAVLGFHRLNVSAAGMPIRFRLEFTTA